MSIIDKSSCQIPLNVKDDLAYLREWIAQQPHLIVRTDDRWLYIFFRGCKFSIQKTKDKIEKYYTLKTALPEFFDNRDPLLPEIQEILTLGLLLPLPKTSSNERRYFFHQCKNADPKKILLTNVIKVFIMILEVSFMEDLDNSCFEHSFICNLDGLTVQHLLQGTPALCKRSIVFLREGFLGRPQGFYMLNSPSIFERMFNMLKPLLGKKLCERVKLYTSNNSTFKTDIPNSILPEKYGGSGSSVSNLIHEWKQKVENYRDWFLEDGKYGCDESKRVTSLNYSDLFGMEERKMDLIDKPSIRVPMNVKKDLAYLKEWISQQTHLIARTDDRWLYMFLRGCKFSIQKTKYKIEKYYTLKTALPEFFGNRDPLLPKIQEILTLGLLLPLPKTSKNETKYFFNQCKTVDPEKVQLTDVLKVFLMVLEISCMEDVNNSVYEHCLIGDLDGLTMQHLIQGTPSLCKRSIVFLRDGFPGRPQGFYMLNCPSMFETVFNMVKPLLGKKLCERVKLYTPNNNTFKKDIPDSILPKEFGGNGSSISNLIPEWKQKVESYRDWFLEDEKYGCDESKRATSINYSDLFGIEGSFKKLSID
ncbi:hypothetical protein FQR65_LT06016 [Abscondita terminalis]|nr:hypothetical protein FQR65_LT06016 [Abscondita terminalis]